MYTVQQFYKNIHLLTNSLVIKFTDVGIAINTGLKLRYNMDTPKDKNLWKYFINLSGEKHITNSDVKITILENNNIVSLTKDVLNEFSYTRAELLKYGSFYKELILVYPDDIGYINGCMLPVIMDDAINAKDGTILNCNKDLIEPNEYSLLRELNQYCINFEKRWNISEYALTDELYVPSFLAVLYSTIPNKIFNIRLNKINTNEVHSFHMEQFFRSNLDLWENVQYLTPSIRMWLYKNLRYIMKNMGTQETFEIILKNIFEKNNVGIAEYILSKYDPELNTDADLFTSVYSNKDVYLYPSKLNNVYNVGIDSDISLNTLVNLELTTLDDMDKMFSNEHIEDIENQCVNKIDQARIYQQQTKVLDINIIRLFRRNGIDLIKSVLDNWIYLAVQNLYVSKYTYIEPNTKNTYELTPITGFLVVLKLLLKITDSDTKPLNKIMLNTIMNRNYTNLELSVPEMFNSDDFSPYIDVIKPLLPNEATFMDTANEFNSYMSERIKFFEYMWSLDSNMENPVNSSNIKILFDSMVETNYIDLSTNGADVTIDELLEQHGIYFDIEREYDLVASVKNLFLLFTGININIDQEIEDSLLNYTEILNKLTTYTTQVIKSIDDSEIMYVPYNHMSVFNSSNGVITILDADIKHALEVNFTKIKSFGNNFKEKITGRFLDNIPSGIVHSPVNGIMEIHNQYTELTGAIATPNILFQILDSNIFYMGPELTAVSNDFIDNISDVPNTDQFNNLIDVDIVDYNDLLVYEYDTYTSGFSGHTDEPNLIVEIED